MTKKLPVILLALLLLAIACFMPGLGSYGMLDPTDSFFIESAREMLEKHHYVTVLFNYKDWLDKPSLAFLLIIFCYKLFGISAWAARLPSAIAGIIMVLATYLFSKEVLGKRTAILAAVILATSPLFLIVGHVALTDEPLAMFLSMALFYIGLCLSRNDKSISDKPIKSKGLINRAAYVFLSLAVLCKGPIAIVITAGVVFLYLLFSCSSFNSALARIKQLRPISALIILGLFCLPYYYLAHVTTDGAFTAQFFLRQNVGRFQGTVNHQEPIWFYVPVILGGFFPWILYFFAGIDFFARLIKRRFKQGLHQHFCFTSRQLFLLFCLAWLICVAGLFTSIPTKLPTYIVPFSPALAILIAAYLDALLRVCKADIKRRHLFILLLPMLFSSVAGLAALILLPKLMNQGISNFLPVGSSLMIVAGFAAAASLSMWQKQFLQAIICMSVASVLACIVLVPYSFVRFYERNQVGVIELVKMAEARGGNLAVLFSSVPSTVFYLHHPVPEVQSMSELANFCRTGNSPHLLLARSNCLNIAELKAAQHILAKGRKWYLLNVEGYPW